MFMLAFPELVDIHVDEQYKKKIRADKVRDKVFDNLTLRVNVMSLESYNHIAKLISEIPNPKTITFQEVIDAVGNYEDSSGYLV